MASHNWRDQEVFQMAMRSNFMADLAQMANGAASAFGGMREEIDNMIRQRMERSLNARGLVTREEFDALRTRHEAVAARLAALEAKMPTKSIRPPPHQRGARRQKPQHRVPKKPQNNAFGWSLRISRNQPKTTN